MKHWICGINRLNNKFVADKKPLKQEQLDISEQDLHQNLLHHFHGSILNTKEEKYSKEQMDSIDGKSTSNLLLKHL